MKRALVIVALLAALPASAQVYDGGYHPTPKVDKYASSPDPAFKRIGADDVNSIVNYEDDLRLAITSGRYHGLSLSPAPAPIDGGVATYATTSDAGVGATFGAVFPDGGVEVFGVRGPLRPRGAATGPVERYMVDDLDERGVNVKNFGARCDNATDDTAAIQAALTYAQTNGGRVVFPPGTCVVTSTLVLANTVGVILQGQGGQLSRIYWNGGSGVPVLQMVNDFQCTVEDMEIDGTGTGSPIHRPSAIIEVQEDTSTRSLYNSRANVFRNLAICGGGSNCSDKGIVFDKSASGLDHNNDFMTIEDSWITNTVTAAISFEMFESKANQIRGVWIDGAEQYGVASIFPSLASVNGGSFDIEGGSINGATVAAVATGTPNDYVVIRNVNSENCAAFYWDLNPTGSGMPILIEGNRYATPRPIVSFDGSTPYFNAIATSGSSPLTIINNVFGDPGDAANLADGGTIYPVIYIGGPQGGGGAPGHSPQQAVNLNIIGNAFGLSGADTHDFYMMFNNATGLSAGPNDQTIYNTGIIAGNSFFSASNGTLNGQNHPQDMNLSAGSLGQVQGLSSTWVRAKNLRGQCSLGGNQTSCEVSFPAAEYDNNYFIEATPTATFGSPATGSNRIASISKLDGGFTLNVEAAPSTYTDGGGAGVTFDWLLVR